MDNFIESFFSLIDRLQSLQITIDSWISEFFFEFFVLCDQIIKMKFHTIGG